MTWGDPIAVTCDELVVTLYEQGRLELARLAWPPG
jgi:hypothetical protein